MIATLTMPAGPQLAAPRRVPTFHVRSADDLRQALRMARAQALTLDGSGMDRVLRVDAERGTVEVQAAASWTAVAEALAPHGVDLRAFAVLDAGLPATVGDSVSVAAPGPDGLPVTTHVFAVALAMPDGELRRADRGTQSDLLALALGGQGVIGVLYSVTLAIDGLRRSAAEALPPVELELPPAPPASPALGEACTTTCLIPPDALEDFLVELRAIVAERRRVLTRVAVRRTLPEPGCRLGWARREWAAVDIGFGSRNTLGASVAAAEVRRALLAAAIARGGAFPIRDLRDASRAQIEACYPSLREFLAEKRRCDPAERLQNPWYRSAMAALRAGTCEVRWARD